MHVEQGDDIGGEDVKFFLEWYLSKEIDMMKGWRRRSMTVLDMEETGDGIRRLFREV